MPELFKRDSDLSTAHAMAWWTSSGSQMQQSSLSRNLSFKLATPPKPRQHDNQLDFQFHDQDSTSTQSTGQSYPEVACVGESKKCGKSLILKESGCPPMQGKSEEGYTKSTLSTHDYTSPHSDVDYRQSFGPAPFSYPTTLCPGVAAAYGPHAMVHPQMMCMTTTRVPLPLDLPQDEPIYVNAKQYHAILRRRQYRAKLEAQNKVSKDRKPYLHESRHRHALNRARGPGGRFLNVKNVQESKSVTAGGRDGSGSGRSQTTHKMWESEVHHQLENFKESDPATSSSEITCASNVDNIFHQQEFGFSIYASHDIRGPMHHGGGGIHGGMQHYLSVHR